MSLLKILLKLFGAGLFHGLWREHLLSGNRISGTSY